MSVSNISTGYSYTQTSSNYQTSGGHHQRKQEMDALAAALQSGNLSGAQQAFSQIQQHTPGGAQSSGNSGDAISTDISALGQALAASDLSTAQSAFSTLQSDFQSAPLPPSAGENSDTDFDSVQSLIDQLSEALASGDLTSAQDAFSSLQEDIQNAPPPPPPSGRGGPGGPGGGNDQVMQAFDDMATALQNGDIDAAQTAFATLQSLAPDNQDSSSTTASTTSSSDTISTDMAALQEALQNSDLDSAQSLFETLLSDLQANAPRHPGMHHYAQNDTAATSSVSVSA